MTFQLSSPTLKEGQTLPNAQVFNEWGYPGQNQSPELRWSGAPEGTQSFALSLYDPDAPTGSGFWHWYVINLPATLEHLPAGAGSPENPQLPASARSLRNDFAQNGFIGAFPPKGDAPHRYVFTIYALDVPQLDLPADATTAFAGFNVLSHTLAKATLTLTYQFTGA